jgi:hypothetical protein
LDIAECIYDRLAECLIDRRIANYPLHHLAPTFRSSTFQEQIAKSTKILTEVVRVMVDLPKHQTKKQKNRRSVVMSLLYCAHLTVVFAKSPNRAN